MASFFGQNFNTGAERKYLKRPISPEAWLPRAKRIIVENKARNSRLQGYQHIVKDLEEDLFDRSGNLKIEFLRRFTALDIHVLILAFKDDADPPGEGTNIWPLWVSRYPHHTEVEWATYWYFWVQKCVQGLNRTSLNVQARIQDQFLDSFDGEDIHHLLQLLLNFQALPNIPIYWALFAQIHTNHDQSAWFTFFIWLWPLVNSPVLETGGGGYDGGGGVMEMRIGVEDNLS